MVGRASKRGENSRHEERTEEVELETQCSRVRLLTAAGALHAPPATFARLTAHVAPSPGTRKTFRTGGRSASTTDSLASYRREESFHRILRALRTQSVDSSRGKVKA